VSPSSTSENTSARTSTSWESIAVGDERSAEFPALTRTMFVKYAGASGDFNPMHHDDTIATQVGNPSVFGHGMLTMGLAARVVKDWFGPEALRRFQVRFSKQVWPGDVLTCTAKVTGKREEGSAKLVDLELAVVNQNGDKAITGAATAVAS
jgi:acyl dehydratase